MTRVILPLTAPARELRIHPRQYLYQRALSLRALAAKEELTLAKLLVRMMKMCEAQVTRPTAATAAAKGSLAAK